MLLHKLTKNGHAERCTPYFIILFINVFIIIVVEIVILNTLNKYYNKVCLNIYLNYDQLNI